MHAARPRQDLHPGATVARGPALRALSRQFARFAAAGALGTTFQYLTYVALVRWLGHDAVIASAAGFTVGALINYTLCAAVVFPKARRHGEAAWRFLVVALVGLVVNSTIVATATRGLGVHYLLAQVAASGGVLAWTFTGHRCWTFAGRA